MPATVVAGVTSRLTSSASTPPFDLCLQQHVRRATERFLAAVAVKMLCSPIPVQDGDAFQFPDDDGVMRVLADVGQIRARCIEGCQRHNRR